MSKDRLAEFLSDLPTRSFEKPADFEAEAISEFVESLGYSGKRPVFQPLIGKDVMPDVIVSENRGTAPWIAIEVKYRQSGHYLRPGDYAQLDHLLLGSGVQFAVLMTRDLYSQFVHLFAREGCRTRNIFFI